MAKYKLTIIIVTFNSEKYIEKCIESIKEFIGKNIDYKIVIVDNSSKDSTPSLLKKISRKDNRVILIINKDNIGFARAVNKGIMANNHGGYFLLLNPDTVMNKSTIVNLIKCSEEYNAGICGGTTVDCNGVENGSYFRSPNLMVGIFDFTNFRKLCHTDKWHKYFYYLDSRKKNKKSFPVDIVTGGFMLVRSSTIKKIGLLDESYFMYLEDVDYCLRAIKAGIKIFHANSSKIIHIGGASSNNKDRIRHRSWLKSRKIFFLKHFGILENIIIQPIFLLDDLLILANKAFKI